MNLYLIAASIVLFLVAFLIGVKKQTWLLSGFNQKRVKNQDKLSKIVGFYSLIIGIVMLAGGIINYPNSETMLFLIMAMGFIALLGYVNTKMVE
ncbi:DUF3784 domain-containing protein [Salinicoccus jeotgali]|jgi:hypothetical protein|uniref:DUF3784 domain-containing protein n=1 Tax=Salinicoccus jeotgali TaxID=381634 RepID=A0ABP7EZP7_9STAP|tara:strand:- start:1797 stop:2078 length:282 start_codon:yes stop_codon:yes gene_type:complete